MSTSDARESKLRVGGGETSQTPSYGIVRAVARIARKKHETLRQAISLDNHYGNGTQREPQRQLSVIRREEAHKALTLNANQINRGRVGTRPSDALTTRPAEPRFTNSLFLKISKSFSFDVPDAKLKENGCSLTGRQSAENSICQVNGQTSTVKLKTVPVFSKENVGLREQQGFRTFPHRSQLQTVAKSIDLENYTELKKQPLGEVSNPARMLSSSVVTVLAPHWSGRLRRNKRFEGTGSTETKDGTTSQEQQAQEPTGMLLTDRSQGQLKVPLMATRWNTVGESVGNEQKRSVIQTGSLDASLGISDNLKRESDILNTGQRKHSHTGLQTGLLSTSSKPTTSSLLLSLRRCNSSGRSPPASPLPPGIKHLPSSTLQCDQTELTPHQDSNTFPPLSSSSFRTPETGTVFSSSSVNNRNRTAFETSLFSGPPINQNTSFSQECQTTLTSSISSPNHSLYNHHSPLQKRSLPRRTTLTSTSWWKQVTQDSCSTSTNVIDKTDTPPVSANNRGKINTTVLAHKSSTNLEKTVKGEPSDLKLEITKDPPNQRVDNLIKERYVSNLNIREQQHPQSLTSHSNNPPQHNICPHKTNLNQLSPSLLRFKNKDTPSDFNTKYNNNHISSSNNTVMSIQNNTQSYTKLPPPMSIASSVNRQVPTSHTASTVPATTNTKISPSFSSKPVDLQFNVQPVSNVSSCSQPSKFTKSVDMTPLGFERSYSAIPVPFHSNPSRTSILAKANSVQHSPVTTAHMVFSSTSNGHLATTTAPSSSHLTQTTNLTLPSSPTAMSCLLTPPATPIITNPNPTCPIGGKTLPCNLEKDSMNKSEKSKEKRERRVTWDDSVDQQCNESDTIEKAEQSQVLSPTRSSVSIKAPSIFSFLRQRDPPNTTHLHPPTPKSSNTQVAKAGKCRSFSSDAVDSPSTHQRSRERSHDMNGDRLTFDKKMDFSTPTHGRTLSMESGTTHYRHSVPLSLPSDFSSGYKHRYSSPPYTTLVTSRSTHGEAENHKTVTPRSLLFHQTSVANYSTQKDAAAVKALNLSRPSMSSVSPQEPLNAHSQNKLSTREGLECGTLDKDKLENRHCSDISQVSRKDKVMLINNRVHIYSQSLPGDKAHGSSPALVTETLVYSFKPKQDSTKAALNSTAQTHFQNTPNTTINFKNKFCQKTQTEQSKEGLGQSQQGSSSGSSTGSQARDKESLKNKVKDSMICKGKLLSVDSNNEQVPKRSKKSSGTPSSILLRSDSDRASKTNNKMDQVFNKLKQTFSTRRSEDDMSFPWKWKKNSHTPSVSSSSDISSVSDVTHQSAKTIENKENKKVVPTDSVKETGDVYQWPENKYIIVPPSDPGIPVTGDVLFSWSDKSLPNAHQDKQVSSAEIISKKQARLMHSPTPQQFDFYDDSVTDYRPTNEFLSYNDCSPVRNTSPSTAHPPPHGKPSSSPRSPFSPFSSLSPLSSLPTSDVTDDSVFYSPKLQRRKESSSHCEAVQGYSLGNSRRCRASTGPPSTNPLKDNECMSSSYADLKYGIEPGRSFSVCSVLSSRPSGPGRISTGSRHMSLGNLAESTLTCGNNSKGLDWSIDPDWTNTYNHMPWKKLQDNYASDSSRMRSRSLPRSFTRHLAEWGPVPPLGHNASSKSPHLWKSNRDPQYFHWDTEGPPTPPPTPPLSPVVRRMSKPSSVSSPTSPGPSRAQQQKGGVSSRGNSLSRSYTSSLDTFEENSDSSSDTTTDDEYYLQTGDMDEKETEL